MRLLTRSDFDGSVCAALLLELGLVDGILYIHPKDLQDNKIEVTGDDILANVPFVEGCGLWFDHHSSEHERLKLEGKFKGASELEPSAAQVIYEYYKKDQVAAGKLKKFEDLIKIVGIADSAQFSKDDILNPTGWIMLAFIADPRTGLGYKRSFRISNFELMKKLPEYLRSKTAEEILSLPDFQERVQVYHEETSKYKALLARTTRIEGNAILIDFRGIAENPVGNRFMEYVLYPEQNISVRIVDGRDKQFAMISVGHSILDRTSLVDVGSLVLKYGGGGHKQVGTCQVEYDDVDRIVGEILQVINTDRTT
ncbi:MAG: exopolyphosphatase [Deltaproteobacteria bacterium]|nr:MAG: exopolyphosphatase [Deltaproteobacteria bacterium]